MTFTTNLLKVNWKRVNPKNKIVLRVFNYPLEEKVDFLISGGRFTVENLESFRSSIIQADDKHHQMLLAKRGLPWTVEKIELSGSVYSSVFERTELPISSKSQL